MHGPRWVGGARLLLGFTFVVFGLDGFLHLIPIPPARPAAERLIGALIASGYFFQMVKCIEVVAGVLLLANRWVPLALTLLAPLFVGIGSIHLFLNPEGLGLMLGLGTVYAALVVSYWRHLRGVLVRLA